MEGLQLSTANAAPGALTASSDCLSLYTLFHLNLAYSSIEEELRPQVIQRCYWPLLELTRQLQIPCGIEASGYTLEAIAALDPGWVDELRILTTAGLCEFVGSGYAQLIGPLVPEKVNGVNQRLGREVYEQLLGFAPRLALVNEQAYSASMVSLYHQAGYEAILMEWDNPASAHPEWDPSWHYLPQLACGPGDEEIGLIWNTSIAFQKFQRYVHSEIDLDEYLIYLQGHADLHAGAFLLYGNDVEIFDFRPGRYHTEAPLSSSSNEWTRISELFQVLKLDPRFSFASPSQVLDLMGMPGSGNRLSLESAAEPIPVKKQNKYNITRWAVTGRNDLAINTACWQCYRALEEKTAPGDDLWRELCYLWSSDFRTHISPNRWDNYGKRLADFKQRLSIRKPARTDSEENTSATHPKARLPGSIIEERGNHIIIRSDQVRISLNRRRGLALDRLGFGSDGESNLVGTLAHGYYQDIALGSDWYSGHVTLECFGRPKVTDLEPVEPTIEECPEWVQVKAEVPTPLGPVRKRIRVFLGIPRVELSYDIDWQKVPIGALRIGHFTLNPEAFDRSLLYYRTHLGGREEEEFHLSGTQVDHTAPVSFGVSARHAVGMTDGSVEFGDGSAKLRLEVDQEQAALVGMVIYREVDDSFFCRLALSAQEVDETRRGRTEVLRIRSTIALSA